MSVIQQIQEKYAKLMAIIIAIALIIFVVMLAFENGGGLFHNSNASAVGKVNGEEIDNIAFSKKVDQQEAYMKTQSYFAQGDTRHQAIEAVWNQEVNQLLIASEINKLGMRIGKKELGDVLYGANPPQYLKQTFTDPSTGVYDAQRAKMQIDQTLKSAPAEQKAQVNEYISEQQFLRLTEKYSSLLSNSINVPRWMMEKQNADNSQVAKVSFVREVYTNIPDSAVTITDKDVEDYISKHKDNPEFKQEESRSIAYVSFSALPTAADSTDARQKLLAMQPDFDSTKDVKQFLEAQGVQTYYDGYINYPRIQVPLKDSIIKTPINQTYGPYLDGGTYTLAKMIAVRTQPDTVNVRHILIATVKTDPQSGQQTALRDSVAAYHLADSIRIAISKGSNFDSLTTQFSDDDGSKAKGGLYEKITSGGMVPEFNDFIFGKPVGEKGIVNTRFGSHYIEILSAKGSSTAYKIAYLTQPIEASDETDANANREATSFAGDSRDAKAFDANVQKQKSKGINKLIQNDIGPNAYQLNAGTSRELVRNIYDADLGEVLQPVRVGDAYVVAMVTEINKKGSISVAKARPLVEPALRNRKKAEIIEKKIGAATTLEAIATALGGRAIETVDSLRFAGGASSAISAEPKVMGAAFNPANKGKISSAIEGSSGVFVIRVDNVTTTPLTNANVAEQRKQQVQLQQQMQMQQGTNALINALMEAGTIKDNRSKFY